MKYVYLAILLLVGIAYQAKSQTLSYSSPFNNVSLEFDSKHNAVTTVVQSDHNYDLLEDQLSYAFANILQKKKTIGWNFKIPSVDRQDWGLDYEDGVYEFNECLFTSLTEARKYLVEYYLALIYYGYEPEPKWKPRRKIKYYIN